MSENAASSLAAPLDEGVTKGLRRVLFLSLVVSVSTVAGFFAYANVMNWYNGVMLGYDSCYYVGFINQVVSPRPLPFAVAQDYVEFLYPIVANLPISLVTFGSSTIHA